jgi:hypothetical protein
MGQRSSEQFLLVESTAEEACQTLGILAHWLSSTT